MSKSDVESKIVEILDDYMKNRGDADEMRRKVSVLMREYVSGPYEFTLSDGITATVDLEIDDTVELKV